MRQTYDDLADKVAADLKESGWTGTYVASAVDDKEHIVPFYYTAGLWEVFGRPELYFSGLSPEIAHRFAWIVHQAMDTIGVVEPGKKLTGLIESGLYFATVEIDPHEAEMFIAHHVNDGPWLDHEEPPWSFKAIQIVWPDPEQRFPWDDGYDAEKHRQTVHGEWSPSQ